MQFPDTNIPATTADLDSEHSSQLISGAGSSVTAAHPVSCYSRTHCPGRNIPTSLIWVPRPYLIISKLWRAEVPVPAGQSQVSVTHLISSDLIQTRAYHPTQGNLAIQILKTQRAVHLVPTRPFQPKPISEQLKLPLCGCSITFSLHFLLTQGDRKQARTNSYLFACKSVSGIQQCAVHSLQYKAICYKIVPEQLGNL